MIFPNANYFQSSVKTAIQSAQNSVKTVLIDAKSITMIDTTAMEMFAKLQAELANQGMILAWSRLRDTVRSKMAIVKLDKQIGLENFYDRITDGVIAFENKNSNN
ncbi:sodium-independent anion transporter [Synechocystis salina LEGE 06099]|nr:sodium-independent anion transporter [Synechocystis salina LEGE 06099]